MNLDKLEAEKALLQKLIIELKLKLVAVDLQIENELERMAQYEYGRKDKGLAF